MKNTGGFCVRRLFFGIKWVHLRVIIKNVNKNLKNATKYSTHLFDECDIIHIENINSKEEYI